jgi:hypothetical protein
MYNGSDTIMPADTSFNRRDFVKGAAGVNAPNLAGKASAARPARAAGGRVLYWDEKNLKVAPKAPRV